MGLFDKIREFKKKSALKKFQKYSKMAQNPKAIREERVEALEFLKAYDELPLAVPALLGRFDFSLEHGINDAREKETALAGVLKFKDKSLPYVKEHLKKSSRIAWPVKILQNIASPEVKADVLMDCLDFGEVEFDQEKVNKNYDILCHLIDLDLGQQAGKLVHFLKAHDERVRFAAAEVLVERPYEGVSKSLEVFLNDESAENTRIRQLVVQAFQKYRWPVPKPVASP